MSRHWSHVEVTVEHWAAFARIDMDEARRMLPMQVYTDRDGLHVVPGTSSRVNVAQAAALASKIAAGICRESGGTLRIT